jgi:hypothetical protein
MVSSEQDFDFLEFYIDGVLQQRWSGILAWSVVSFPMSAGMHTVRWRYAKDNTVAAGGDAGWIDSVLLPAIVPITSPSLVAVFARKVHGVAGTFNLPLSGAANNPTIEPRQGTSHTIVFTFDKPVTAGVATVIEGFATAGVPTFSGSEMRVPLTGVANQQYVTVTVSNVNSVDGGTGGSGSIRVGFLLGDVNQNRVVTLSDLGQVNAQVAQPVNSANFSEGRERERNALGRRQGNRQHADHEGVAGTMSVNRRDRITGVPVAQPGGARPGSGCRQRVGDLRVHRRFIRHG